LSCGPRHTARRHHAGRGRGRDIGRLSRHGRRRWHGRHGRHSGRGRDGIRRDRRCGQRRADRRNAAACTAGRRRTTADATTADATTAARARADRNTTAAARRRVAEPIRGIRHQADLAHQRGHRPVRRHRATARITGRHRHATGHRHVIDDSAVTRLRNVGAGDRRAASTGRRASAAWSTAAAGRGRSGVGRCVRRRVRGPRTEPIAGSPATGLTLRGRACHDQRDCARYDETTRFSVHGSRISTLGKEVTSSSNRRSELLSSGRRKAIEQMVVLSVSASYRLHGDCADCTDCSGAGQVATRPIAYHSLVHNRST
jgi:hypothetical protein